MADYTLEADQQGVYEIMLTADTDTTIDIHSAGYRQTRVTINHNNGTAPVYYTWTADGIAVADPNARQLMPNTWEDIEYRAVDGYTDNNDVVTMHVISAMPANISVNRPA